MNDNDNPYRPPVERGTASASEPGQRRRMIVTLMAVAFLVALLAIHAFLFIFILNDVPGFWD